MNAFLQKAAVTKGYKTAAAGTEIAHTFDPKAGLRCVILALQAVCGTTAQNIYFMQAKKTTVKTAAASAANVVYLTADPTDPDGNATAAGDIVCIEMDDGTYDWDAVSAFGATSNKVTIVGTLNDSVGVGNGFWTFGTTRNSAHQTMYMAASEHLYRSGLGGIHSDPNVGYPMRVAISNATAACFWGYLSAGYINS